MPCEGVNLDAGIVLWSVLLNFAVAFVPKNARRVPFAMLGIAADRASQGSRAMPSYVMLANWTDQGVRSIDDLPKRIDQAKRLLGDMGGQFSSLHMTMGAYDLIGIYDAPDDAVAVRFTLMIEKMGNLRTTSLKAFPEQALREIVRSI